MKINFNCYKVLEIANFAQKEEIKRAYRKLVMIHHPDRGGDGEKIKIINVAYEVFNKEKNKYDNWLHQQLQSKIPSFTIIIHGWAQYRSDNWTSSSTTSSGWW